MQLSRFFARRFLLLLNNYLYLFFCLVCALVQTEITCGIWDARVIARTKVSNCFFLILIFKWMDSRFLPDTRTGRCFCCNWDRSLCPCRSGKVRKPDSPTKLPDTVDLTSPRNNRPTCRLGNRIYSLDDWTCLPGRWRYSRMDCTRKY